MNKVIVHRWPVLKGTGGPAKRREVSRTSKPLETKELDATLAGPLIHTHFGMAGWYDFRLSTGRATTQDIWDWCVAPESLKAWREYARLEKLKEKKK